MYTQFKGKKIAVIGRALKKDFSGVFKTLSF